MSTFAFLPRSVKRRKTETTPVQDQVSASVASISTPAGPPIASAGQSSEQARPENSKGKEKEQKSQGTAQRAASNASNKGLDPEDLARLVWLALSDYSLWSDTDLRRKIDWASDVQEGYQEGVSNDDRAGWASENEGYISLSYLKKNSPVFLQAGFSHSFAEQPETAYVKALRSHAADLVEVRLILSDEGSSNFASDRWSKKMSSPTGYEVRRKIAETSLSKYGKVDWHNLTIYVENIPVQYRSVYGTAKLMSSLLPPSGNSISKIQNISFPSHHNDKLGALPTCKGFSLVTLSTSNDVQFLLDEWPWEEPKKIPGSDEKGSKPRSNDATKWEAARFGLRCLSKSRWEELKAEYLVYRQQLIEELAAENEAQEQINRMSSNTVQVPRPPQYQAPEEHDTVQAPKSEAVRKHDRGDAEPATIHPDSPYPSGCLVFVRNVHPETNKTSLRSLFSRASKTAEKDSTVGNNDGLDYVDYTKGLDSCYLRFSAPSHAQPFVQYFTSNPTTQTSGLDGTGESPSSLSKGGPTQGVITPELVSGKREELYWQKVPEKVRRQAVDKALKVIHGAGNNGPESAQNGAFGNDGKKRRRGK